jgi:hypothetical protein
LQLGIFGGAAAWLVNITHERQVYSDIIDYVCEAEELGFKSLSAVSKMHRTSAQFRRKITPVWRELSRA